MQEVITITFLRSGFLFNFSPTLTYYMHSKRKLKGEHLHVMIVVLGVNVFELIVM